jgi:competence protein ComEC
MGTRIFWALVAGCLAGIFVRSFFSVGWGGVGFLLILAVGLACVRYVVRSDIALVGVLFLIACAGGISRMHVATLHGDDALNQYLGHTVVLEGYIFEEPDVRENTMRLSVRVEHTVAPGATTTVSAGVLVSAPLHADVAYGDRVRVEGKLQLPESFDAGAGRTFNYPAYLAKDGIGYGLSFAKVEKIGVGKKNPIKAAAILVKQKYLEGLSLALPEPHAGLAAGITAGDKRGLGAEWSAIFQVVGLTHIVVLSGYNIMIAIWFVDRITRRAHRHVRYSLSVGAALFLALITGLASSSVRAAAMAIIAIIGGATGRTYLALRALALVACGMVLWNPYVLAFDPGFQLSIIATWGLLALAPLIAAKLTFLPHRFAIRDIAATTTGAQLAVLPLLLYQTGQLSLVALPANLLALIAVSYAMFASFIAGIAGLVAGPIAVLFGLPAYALLSYILFIAEWAAHVPFAVVLLPAFPFALVVLAYAALLMFAHRQSASRSRTSSDS